MFDEELPKKKDNSEFPKDLETMSVKDLGDYVQELNSEIERVQKDIEEKQASKEAADSVFKK